MKFEDELFTYKPTKEDPIDTRLATFINSKPLKMRTQLSLVRESQGVYRYMRRRVFIKQLEDQIVIRVGGGYLTMDDFVAQYCINLDSNAR